MFSCNVCPMIFFFSLAGHLQDWCFSSVCPRILFSFLGTSRINVFSSKSSPGSCFPSWAHPFKSPHGLIYFTKTSIVTGPKINTWKSWKRKNKLAQLKNRWYVISLICYTWIIISIFLGSPLFLILIKDLLTIA